ncbi:MAG: hypothetical protein ACFWTZ_05135 [Burkholderia sp.]|jgi:RNA polymerase sigma-54 factor
METALRTELRQQQILSQVQQQSLRLLQMPAAQLAAEADELIRSNPLLEREDPSSESSGAPQAPEDDAVPDAGRAEADCPVDAPIAFRGAESTESDDSPFDRIASRTTFREDLHAELGCMPLPPRERLLAECLIEELSDRGFLETPVEEIVASYAHVLKEAGCPDASPEEWARAARIVRRLDPPGVGASGPVESLLIQTDRLVQARRISLQTAALMRLLITKNLLKVAQNDRAALLRTAGGDAARLDEALGFLRRLSPYPFDEREQGTVQYVVPDVLVLIRGGRPEAVLNPACQISVRLRDESRLTLFRRSVGEARWQSLAYEAKALLQGLAARRETLLRVASDIVREQSAFFTDPHAALRPMTMADVAARIGLSESTVSRTVNGKFLHCRRGTLELRSLFSSSLAHAGSAAGAGNGEEQSADAAQRRLRALVEAESPAAPLSDSELSEKLAAEGFRIARRTVAKYREALGIAPARLRRRR